MIRFDYNYFMEEAVGPEHGIVRNHRVQLSETYLAEACAGDESLIVGGSGQTPPPVSIPHDNETPLLAVA